ncbi:MAG: hypothetical protein KBS68_02020 [Clostridiales bacterium]|nr:hypothetical protein [Candidatus Crickella merdequi]
MIEKSELKSLALDACIDMIGRHFVMQHKDDCCASCGILNDGLFHYWLGMDTRDVEWSFGGETPMEYAAHVLIDINTGALTRDYESSRLPA